MHVSESVHSPVAIVNNACSKRYLEASEVVLKTYHRKFQVAHLQNFRCKTLLFY